MNKKLTFITISVLVVGTFALTRPQKPIIPSDFKDAVADRAQDFNTAIPKLSGTADIPTPKSAQVGSAVNSEVMLKSIFPTKSVRAFQKTNKGVSVSPVLDKPSMARLSDLAGDTAFDKLANLFKEGVPATPGDLTGWHAGRLVADKNLNVFEGALLTGKKVILNPNDGGPLFGKRAFKVMLIASNTPSAYDDMNTQYVAEVKNALEIYKEEKHDYFIMAFPEAKCIFSGKLENGTRYEVTLEERVSRGFIVEHYSMKSDDTITEDYYSYYFKNVTPK